MPSYQELIAEADAAYHELRLEQALAAYQAASQQASERYRPVLGIARTLMRMRSTEEAHRALDRCVELAPERFEAYVTRGILYFLSDELDAAEGALEKARDKAPGEPEPLLSLAQVYCDRGQFERADRALADAREIIGSLDDPDEQEQLAAMADHAETYRHLSANDTEAAYTAAQRVIEREEANPYAACLAYSNLGIMETREKNYDQAIEYLERAYETNPHFYRAAEALGRVLLVQGDHERAAEVLAHVIEHDGATGGDTHYAYAMALSRTGRRQEARQQFGRAAEKGVSGPARLMALWQTIWLSDVARYGLIGLVLLGLAIWLIFGEPSTQAITLLVLIIVILTMQRVLGQRR